MTRADLQRYSYAFHEAGHAIIAYSQKVPYLDARISDGGEFGGAFRADIDEINARLAENKGDTNFTHLTVCNLVFVLKGGEAVDRELVKAPATDVARRAGGDTVLLEEVIRPIYVDHLGLPEQTYRAVVEHADRECRRIITSQYVPIMIARLANVIFEKGVVPADELNGLIASMRA